MSPIRRKAGLELKKNLPGYLLMAPAVIAVLALSVYPLLRGIYLSFLNYNIVRSNDPAFNTFAGLQNYIDIFKDKVFIQSIGNTVKWTVVNLLVQLVAAMLLALALNQKTERKICIQNPDSGSMGSSPCHSSYDLYIFIQCKCRYH